MNEFNSKSIDLKLKNDAYIMSSISRPSSRYRVDDEDNDDVMMSGVRRSESLSSRRRQRIVYEKQQPEQKAGSKFKEKSLDNFEFEDDEVEKIRSSGRRESFGYSSSLVRDLARGSRRDNLLDELKLEKGEQRGYSSRAATSRQRRGDDNDDNDGAAKRNDLPNLKYEVNFSRAKKKTTTNEMQNLTNGDLFNKSFAEVDNYPIGRRKLDPFDSVVEQSTKTRRERNNEEEDSGQLSARKPVPMPRKIHLSGANDNRGGEDALRSSNSIIHYDSGKYNRDFSDDEFKNRVYRPLTSRRSNGIDPRSRGDTFDMNEQTPTTRAQSSSRIFNSKSGANQLLNLRNSQYN